MKTEAHDIVIEAAKASPGVVLASLTLNDVVALASIGYILLSALYLLRKWWREETEWGIKLKRWAERHGLRRSAPIPLDDVGQDD
jgi:hypothetical protein